MSAVDVVTMAYALAKKGRHKELRQLIAADATWEPTARGRWRACTNADDIVRTLVWRAGPMSRLRPGETVDLSPFVVFRLRGRRLHRLGARGFWSPKLYQVVEVQAGKIVRMHDYGTMEEALASTGHGS